MSEQVSSGANSINVEQRWRALPAIDLRHVLRLSDDTGIFQHALYATADPHHGYCIDDNSRALLAALYDADVRVSRRTDLPIHRYLAFVQYAFNDEVGRFRNFMSFDRRWLEDVGSEDSQGRTIWALGAAVDLAPDDNVRELAQSILARALPTIETITSIRSRAFAIFGLQHMINFNADDARAVELRNLFAEALLDEYEQNATAAWPWWEPIVAYANAKLPHTLLVAGHALGRDDMIKVAINTLNWLTEVQTAPEGHLSIIGNDGWFTPDSHGGKPAQFDQQPLDAHAMVHACLDAATITGDREWERHALRCFDWFTGGNDVGLPLYDSTTGGCRDGLHPDSVNKNQGAESTLAYLLSVLDLHRYVVTR